MSLPRFLAHALIAIAACLPTLAIAVTYSSVSVPFSWIDASSHAQIGYNTVPYKFNNTGGCGTTPPILDDTLSDNIPLGFTFTYGGVNFTSVRVMSNGRLQFNNNTTCGFGSPVTQLPYPNAGLNYTLRIYGNDLDPTLKSDVAGYNTVCTSRATCYVSYATIGTAPNRSFVVTWSNVPEWTAASTATGSYSLQIILQENGEFIYQYGPDTPGPGNVNAQIGWQINTTDYAVYALGFPANNSAIKFYIPSPVAEFRMDESSWGGAGTVINSTASGTYGSPVGTAQTVTGGYICRGGNIPSNGSTATIDAIDTGFDLDSQIGSSGTVTFWYKSNAAWNGAGSQDSQLLDATVANNRWFYLVKQNSSGRLSFNLTDNANNNFQVNTGNNAIAANTWVHIGVTWNLTPVAANNRLRIYINGALSQSTAIATTQPLSTAIGTLYVGDNRSSFVTNPGSGNSANGVIDEVKLYDSEVPAAVILRDFNATHSCPPALDHVRIDHSGAGVTCAGSSVIVNACAGADTGGSCTANTDGLTGNVIAKSSGGATLATVPFTIASGNSSATVTVPVTSTQTVTFETSGLSVTPSNSWTCWNGSSASCSYDYNDAGFIFDVPHHVSEVSQTINVSAVKKANNSSACTTAFSNVTKSVNFKCTYSNPLTGTLPVRVGGNALNASNSTSSACDAGGRAVSLAFDASGVASTTLQYADVGDMSLTATYTGSGSDAGLTMTGSDTFIAAPKDFAFGSITAPPIKAGNNFSATVTARNNIGNATPNFGKEITPEGVTLSFAKYQPTGIGAVNGTFSSSVGTFTGGAANANLNWSEVGTIDLTAKLTSGSYLGSGLNATGTTGTTGAVGRFIPDHFDTVVTQGCSTGSYTYSGQPFTAQITARNLAGSTTLNYDGSANTTPNFAKTVTLSDANAVTGGVLSPTSVAVSIFIAGVTSPAPAPAFTFTRTTPDKAPAAIKLRATDSDGATSSAATEGTATIRIGRLILSNAFGSEKASMQIPVQAQYWSGSAWVLNANDSCTAIPATSVASSNYLDNKGATTAAWTTTASGPGTLAGGKANITLTAPSPTSTGSVDVAINLGTGTTDTSCLANHPAMPVPAVNLSYLRGKNGSCPASNTYAADPSARVTFGVYAPETKKQMYIREIY